MSRFAVALLTGLFLFAPAAQAAGPVATRAVLAREMRRAGTFSGADVVDLDSGAVLYARKATTPRMPASIEKLYTSATALLRYGAAGRLTTTVLASALPDADGTIEGDLALRGGGDPTFAPADVDGLADRLVQGGLRRLDGRVIGDESLFDAFRGVPASNFQLTNEVGPLSALAYNHGRTGAGRPYYQSSPAQFTADALTRALKRHGVKVTGRARAGLAATGMLPLSKWQSPTVAEIARAMNVPSDNYVAEMLLKGLGARFGGSGSTAAGAAVVRDTVGQFGVRPQVIDGSGLSRGDLTSPRDVVSLLTGMASGEAAAPFAASLAVMGRTGTLTYRLRGSAAQDRCRGKTGTLRDVSTLAGYCDTVGGARVAFAFMMNRTWPRSARVRQDHMTAALARYSATPGT